MLDWKTAALMFSWLMLVGLVKGRVEEGLVKGTPRVEVEKGVEEALVKGIPRVDEGLIEGIPRMEEDKGVSLSSRGLAPDCCLACCTLRRWFEYFIGTSLTVLSGN